MKTIKGIITEITEGMEADSITVQNGKQKSKLKLPIGEARDFMIGGNITIVIETDETLFNKEDIK